MSADQLIQMLEKLQKLHESLYNIALEKTETIKKGDMESLQKTMVNEQKHIAAIQVLEAKRQQAAEAFTGGSPSATLTECISKADDTDKPALSAFRKNIREIVEKLKYQNELNQQLIYQSLQFVNMSLSLLRPARESVTYSRPDKPKVSMQQRAVFNTRA